MRSTAGRLDVSGIPPSRLGYGIRSLTVGGVLAHQAATHGDRCFVRHLPDGRTWTYREFDRDCNRLANGLLRLGVRPGECVALMMENSPEQLMLFFALARIGAVNAPVNAAARGDLLRHYLDLAEAVAVIVDAALLPRLQELRAALPALRHVVALEAPDGRADARTRAHADGGATVAFDSIDVDDAAPPAVPVRFSDLAMLSFTSGTTGPSKAARYSHAALLQGAISCVEAWGYRPDDVYYVCLPFFHMNAVRGSTYIALVQGATVVLARRFSASRFWDDVRESGATTFNLLGSMLNILWSQPRGPNDRDHSARLCRSAPMPSFAREFEERFGLRLVTTYGLSDFGAPVAFTVDDPPSKLGSSGRVRDGWQVRIVDDDDFDVPPGEPGEIVLRALHMWSQSSGYHRMPEATVESMRNGWFHTGDLGRLDADGYLWYVGRRKDSIRRRGENVSAWEVEHVIASHPAVADVAVYGVASDMSEEEVAASVVLRQGATLAEAALIAFCSTRMAYFMVPRYLQFVPDLPRTPSQKVEKYRLRAAAADGMQAWWDREAAGIVLAR